MVVEVIGGGPAGSVAALAAKAAGADVCLYEKSTFPRHKVCGEFLSPEILPLLDRIGIAERFLALGPARLRRVRLHLGGRMKSWNLSGPAWGLSR